ncbi:hypothetical protein ILUMI_26332 [Ignelater luminosus]|uniref:Regucalcin n=1 Tax=Ignelater luminosus TaxID=2038154 RepID=A0A8K0C9X2_IGNLU|nr:hypothetical protein ILUMI_26332 [Ignelater luminosus]
MAPVVERISESWILAEAPHWDVETQSLYYVDIIGKTIHKYTPSSNKHTQAYIGEHVSFIIPVEGEADQFVISINREVHLITWDGVSETVTKIRKIAEVDDQPDAQINKFNDGKTDPTGKLWAGTMGRESATGKIIPNNGTLYSINKDGQVKSQISNVYISNGLAWAADLKKFFFIDTAEKRIDQFDFDVENEAIANRQPFFTFKEHDIAGSPDGQTIDADGNLWVAVFNGSKVIKIDSHTPETLLDSIELPAKEVTSVAFGGPDLDELYVTTARIPNYREQLLPPDNGALYRITELNAKGLPGVRIKL